MLSVELSVSQSNLDKFFKNTVAPVQLQHLKLYFCQYRHQCQDSVLLDVFCYMAGGIICEVTQLFHNQ